MLSHRTVEHLQIRDAFQGQRIDNFLMTRIKGVPRSHIYRLLRRGEVRVNKGRVKPSYRLRAGDQVRIPPLRTAPPSTNAPTPKGTLARLEKAILFEDDRLIVLNKPAGLAVHGGSGIRWGIIEALRQLRPKGDLELVHRLDRETSGCLLVAKRRSVLRELHRAMRENRLQKRYLALLCGALPEAKMLVDVPLRKNSLHSGERLVRVDFQQGRPARTRFRRLQVFDRMTLVEAELLTGRTHQIRVHAAHLGTPIAGDEKYGGGEIDLLGKKRLFLHAKSLGFFLPSYGERLHFSAPLPREWESRLQQLSQATLR